MNLTSTDVSAALGTPVHGVEVVETFAASAQDLLRYYWEALDVPDYSWDLCRWDFRFSVISNLFQSVFQRSVKWYQASLTAMDTLDSRATLTEPPPT